jgi:hypothetical protein
MDAVSATTVSATTASTATSSAGSTTSSSDASKTTGAKKSFSTLFAAAKDDLKKGEKLSKVDGHEFARIKGGTRDDMCINLSGNERSGQAFDLIWRDGRQFHVYGGKGADHKVVEVGKKAATTDSTSTTPAATGTTTDSTSGGTSSTGTTTTTTTPAKTASDPTS